MNSEQEKEKKGDNSRKTSKKNVPSKRINYKKELAAVKDELEKLTDQHLRILAEFDNYKKRRERDFSSLVDNANSALLEELLPILDDFNRSFNSHKKADKTFFKGTELIYQKFTAVLEKFGITAIDSIDQPFNPELHEAILQMEQKDKPPDIILEEAVKGYKFKEKVLRYAKVVVSK